MSFFPMVPSYQNIRLSTIDLEFSKYLIRTVYENGKITVRPRVERWAYFFHLLDKNLDHDTKRIDRVLNWLCSHFNDKYTPKVYSAKTFREKFFQIEDVMNRQLRDNPQVIISKCTKRVVKDLENLSWPKGFQDKLPPSVQISLDNYSNFLIALKRMKKVSKKTKWLVEHIENNFLRSPQEFITIWFTNAFLRIASWEQWSGSPMSIIFSVESKQFKKEFMSWVKDFTFDYNFGLKVLEELVNAD